MQPYIRDKNGRVRIVRVYGKIGHRYRGKYMIYYDDDDISRFPNKPKSVQNYIDCAVGDWIRDKNGVIMQVLDVFVRGEIKYAILPVGAVCLMKNGVPLEVNFLNRWRPNWTKFANTGVTSKYANQPYLTTKDELLIRKIFEYGFDYYKAYEEVNGCKINTPEKKWRVNRKIRKLFRNPRAEKLMARLTDEVLKESGLDAKEWFKRLVNSVPEVLTTPTHVTMWTMVARTNPELRRALDGEDELQSGLLPMGGEVVDAKFNEVSSEANKEIEQGKQEVSSESFQTSGENLPINIGEDGRPKVTI